MNKNFLRLALIGKDVSASHSGRMHAFILRHFGVEVAYQNVSVSPENFERTFSELLNCVDGINITIPYKLTAIPLLDSIDGDAAMCGAVNTVVTAKKPFWAGEQTGKNCGYNTDGKGFLLMLKNEGIDVFGKTVLVLGSGGAGRCVAKALKENGATVYLTRRKKERLPQVCKELGVYAYDTENEPTSVDILINCTGVGMHESVGQSPVGREMIERTKVAIDLIYRPERSAFLEIADELGKRILNGKAMLFYQAYYADCLFLGRKADEETATKLYCKYCLEELENKA